MIYLWPKEGTCNRLRAQGQDVFIISAFSFYGDNDYSWLSFSPRVLNEARKYLNIFDENCIGVHVRRTDHVKSRAYSPISLFFDAMQKEIDKNEGVRFFLATDSEIDRQLFIARFGERIITRNDVSERFSNNGAFDGVVDLLLLSKTKKLYGSYWSSFSDVASRIGCIERIVVRDSWQDPVLKIAELNDLISKLMLQTTQLSVKRR